MPRLEMKNQAFQLDGDPFFFYGGEVHYFRTDPSQWHDRLSSVKDLGITVVSTYVPWLWHEPRPGQFDFTGATDPRRNLTHFIKLAHSLGLLIFVRPGPYVMSELRQEGLPAWLLEQHPEIIAQDARGNLHPTRMVSYLHPTFLRFADRWYDAVSQALTPYFAQNGGPVILTQLDNEVGMLHWVSTLPDQSEDAESEYRKFSMGNIASLYGSGDYWQRGLFWRQYRARYLKHLEQEAARHGFPAPYIINVHGFRDYSVYSRGVDYPIGLSQLFEAADVPGAFLGGDFYPGHVGYDNFHDLALAVTYTAATNSPEAPLFSPEFQSGRFQDRPHLGPSDLDLAARVSVSYGLNGLNWYMLAGGDNPGDIGLFGRRHEWQAPIASDGTLRGSAPVVGHLGSLFRTFGSALAGTKPVPDIHIGFYSAYYMTENPAEGQDSAIVQEIVGERDAWHFDGIYRILVAANLTVQAVAVDKEAAILDPVTTPILWMATCRYMDRRTQTRLAEYANAGGTLILGPRIPEWDLAGNPCRVLADSLHLPAAVAFGQRGLATILDVDSVFCANYTTFAATEQSEVLGHVDRGSIPGAIITRQKTGRGRTVLAGCALPDLYQYYHALVRTLAETLGCQPGIAVSNPAVHATRREGGQGGFLFVHNFDETEQLTHLALAPNSRHGSLEWDLILPPRSGLMLPYGEVPLQKGAASVVHTPAEITCQADGVVIHRSRAAGQAMFRMADQEGGSPAFLVRSGNALLTGGPSGAVTVSWLPEDHPQPIVLEINRNDTTRHNAPSAVASGISTDGL